MISVTAGDYYAEVSVRLSQTGVVYVYPLPVEVEVAPDDSTIVTYGFSASVAAGESTTIYVEELESRSSYTLYISGRNQEGVMSNPSRIVRVVTTTARLSSFAP